MALRDVLAGLFGAGQSPNVQYVGPMFQQMIAGFTPEELYRTQPHLRTVIDFRARNAAQCGLQTFKRVSDTDRVRERGSVLARLIAQPNESQTQYEWLTTLVSDFDLYDFSMHAIAATTETASGWALRPIPPSWVVEMRGGTIYQPAVYVIAMPDGSRVEIPAEAVLVFHGYNPGRARLGSSTVEALKNVLSEQVQAWAFRQQVWANAGRFGAVLQRPKDAPGWSSEAQERFTREWKARWTGSGGAAEAGGTPILEDGMTIQRVGFSAREDEWSEVSKLALTTTAAAYHVNPVMVGLLDNANFSNTREFRKMLYTDTLGPLFSMIEAGINGKVARAIGADPADYVEFNIAEKLQGDFIEQGQLLQAAVGSPYMTRNEARARLNLPALDEADGLVVPLNVLIGGQASPQDSGSQNQRAGLVSVKSRASFKSPDSVTESRVQKVEAVLDAFYRRQADEVLAKLTQKADAEWWDGEAWNAELSAELFAVSQSVADEIGQGQAEALGFAADEYDTDRTRAFLKAVAESRAGAINATTRKRIEKALAADVDPADVFDEARSARTGSGALAFVAALAGFAVLEAAQQLISPRQSPQKTWLVQSQNPRPEHAAMDGETVGMDEPFSNGAQWPGDVSLGAEGVSNCECGLEITFNM